MKWLFGLDLGQAQDYSALVLLEYHPPVHDDTLMGSPVVQPGRYEARYAHRWQLGTPYTEVTRDVAHRLHRAPVNGTANLIVDRTGVGAAVCDVLRQAGLHHIPVHVHGGAEVTRAPRGYNVPKRDIVSSTQVLLQQDRLHFARTMPLMEPLFHELASFRARINEQTAHDTYSAWREQDHDDLVFALAIACWWGEKYGTRPARMVPYRV